MRAAKADVSVLRVERGEMLARGLVHHDPALWAVELRLIGALNSLWGNRHWKEASPRV